MTDSLSTDFFSSLEQCNFTMPSLTRYDTVFPQFDPSTFISSVDPPDTNQSPGSDNEAVSPSINLSPIAAISPLPSPSDLPTIGTKRKSETPVTLPGPVVQELIKSQEEKKSRLARKAELARQSRRKKKMRMSDLETEVAELQGQLAQAKEEIKRLGAKNQSILARQQPVSKEPETDHMIEEILKLKGPALTCSNPSIPKKEPKSPNEFRIEQLIPELMMTLQRETISVNQNVQALHQSLVPNMAVQFLEWSLSRGDQFYSEATQFGHLFYETMQSTPQQVQALLALRKTCNEDFKLKDMKVFEALEAVKQALVQRAQQVDTFSKLRSIFTPQQLATYLQYVKMFGHVLVKVPA